MMLTQRKLMTGQHIQTAEQLRQAVLMQDEMAMPVSTLAGVDVACEKGSNRLVAQWPCSMRPVWRC